jgi:hypothetical protein
MQIYSHRSHSVLTCTLIVLFLALSFNAYACLLPLTGSMSGAMSDGCSTPDEQPMSQHCDAFKTLGMLSADNPSVSSDYQALCLEDTASLVLRINLASHSNRLSAQFIVGPPKDLLLQTSVLRI